MEGRTSGEWDQERLYVLRTLDDLKAEQKRLGDLAAAERAAVLEKQTRDIKAAHDKIRDLQNSKTVLKTKTWLLGGALAVLFEVAKAIVLHGWKP
jgi:hypothetical protein